MLTVNINHAFDGFLYAPLFLAYDLGFFPKCANLKFRNGDSACLDALCGHSAAGEKNWFAICDPFSVDVSAKVPEHGDEIYVVGCLVDKLPVWVYNPDPSLTPVNTEARLRQYNSNIKKLVCYKEDTTGYLVGKRLKKLCFVDSNLETKEFGEEFKTPIPNDTAVATSDVLRIVYGGLNDRKIIFNYPKRSSTELCPFLFTGILTLKQEVVEENLWIVLNLLAGIKRALDLLRQSNVPPECISILTQRFQSQLTTMGVVDPASQAKLVRDTVTYAFHTENIYSETLKPEKAAWDNAKKQWEQIMQRTFADAEERREPIPALLIKSTWRRDAELRSELDKGAVSYTSVFQSDKFSWYHQLILPAAFAVDLFCLFLYIRAWSGATKPILDNIAGVVAGAIGIAVMIGFTGWLLQELLRFKTKHIVKILATILTVGVLVFSDAVAAIK